MDKLFQSDVANILSELAEIQILCPPHYTPAAWLEILRLQEMRKQTHYLRDIAIQMISPSVQTGGLDADTRPTLTMKGKR